MAPNLGILMYKQDRNRKRGMTIDFTCLGFIISLSAVAVFGVFESHLAILITLLLAALCISIYDFIINVRMLDDVHARQRFFRK